MARGLIARASIVIHATGDRVWNALVEPDLVHQWMLGTRVESEWREGSRIYWRGEWKGRPYVDKGVIRRLEPGRRLQFSHFSPLSGKPDLPANYHIVTIDLAPDGVRTRVLLTQTNNDSAQVRDHSQKNWVAALAALKQVVEA